MCCCHSSPARHGGWHRGDSAWPAGMGRLRGHTGLSPLGTPGWHSGQCPSLVLARSSGLLWPISDVLRGRGPWASVPWASVPLPAKAVQTNPALVLTLLAQVLFFLFYLLAATSRFFSLARSEPSDLECLIASNFFKFPCRHFNVCLLPSL